MRIGVYPGSFDPFTEGHLDILNSAVPLFDKVVVGVLCNAAKKPVFTAEERVDMIRRVVEDREIRNVEIASFNGLLVDFFDVRGLAERVAMVLDNPAAFDFLRENARETVLQKYDSRLMLERQWQFVRQQGERR